MKNKIKFGLLLFIFIVLVMTTVRADIWAQIEINSNESIDSKTYLSTENGSIHWTQTENKNSYYNGDAVDWDSLGWQPNKLENYFEAAVDKVLGVDDRRLARDSFVNILNQLSRVFVTRPERDYDLYNMEMLNVRLEAVERTLEKIAPEEYCESKLELLKENPDMFDSVQCGNVTYKIVAGEIVGIRMI